MIHTSFAINYATFCIRNMFNGKYYEQNLCVIDMYAFSYLCLWYQILSNNGTVLQFMHLSLRNKYNKNKLALTYIEKVYKIIIYFI